MTTRLRENDHVWIYVWFKRDAGGYLGKALGLPGCVTWGTSLEEAKRNMGDVIRGYIETAFANGIAIKPNRYLRTTPPSAVSKKVSCVSRIRLRSLDHMRGGASIGEWQQQRTALLA